MPVFANQEELMNVMLKLWEAIKNDKSMAEPLLKSQLTVQFSYREPEGQLTVDASNGKDLIVSWGSYEKKPIIEMSMKADVAHEFWLGKVNVPVAILTGKMISRGPAPKALALLPTIKPAFALYPVILKELGKSTLLNGHEL